MVTLIFEKVTNAAAGFTGDGKVQPVRIRLRALGGNDGNFLAALQRLRQRRQAPINATSDTGVTDISMHRIGEIYCSRAVGQLNDLAFRGKDINLIGKEVNFYVFNKLE